MGKTDLLNGVNLTLTSEGRSWRLRSEDGSIDVRFTSGSRGVLRRLLKGRASNQDLEMLRGLTLLDRVKYTNSFLEGDLSVRELGRALYRRALRTKNGEYVLRVAEWLRRNGFKHLPAEIVFKKTLL